MLEPQSPRFGNEDQFGGFVVTQREPQNFASLRVFENFRVGFKRLLQALPRTGNF